MSERLRDIVRAVGERTDETPHLDRVRDRIGIVKTPARRSGLESLHREIAEEIAYSLGRAERHIVEALEGLARIDASRAEAVDAETREALRLEYNEARLLAMRRFRDLVIQREALGFRRHDELRRLYPIPPALER